MKRKFCMFICLLTTLGLLSSCNQNGASTGTNETQTKVENDQPKESSTENKVITIWYEGGDARLPFFKAIEKEMQKEYPNISIDAVTFDNNTFKTKVLQAATMVGGVDLVFNDASRILELQQQSNEGFLPLNDVLTSAQNNNVVLDADKSLSSQGENLIVLPVNRTIAGLGVKTDVSGVTVDDTNLPKDFTKFVALGEQYKKSGINGFTMHLGSDPGQVFNLFSSGNGKNNVWLNDVPESQVKKNEDLFEKVISLYAGENAIYDKDALSEGFAEMYTKIQSGKVGMFRVGNWNAANWDKADSGVGEYTVVPWPSFTDGSEGSFVVLNTRGFAIPKNATNIEEAKTFLKYVYANEPQKNSLDTMGSCLDMSVVNKDSLSKNQKIFFDESIKLTPVDSYAGEFSYYNALLEAYENGLTTAFSSKNQDEIKSNIDKIDKAVNDAIAANK